MRTIIFGRRVGRNWLLLRIDARHRIFLRLENFQADPTLQVIDAVPEVLVNGLTNLDANEGREPQRVESGIGCCLGVHRFGDFDSSFVVKKPCQELIGDFAVLDRVFEDFD